MKQLLLIFAVITLCGCGNKGKLTSLNLSEKLPQKQTYECKHFSVSYPNGYYAKEDGPTTGNFRILQIGRDSLDKNFTLIMWEAPGSFPSTVDDFITIFVSSEMKDYNESNTFYDIMMIDSVYRIDGYPTYSITSIFTEDEDTIIQSRTGLIIPNIMYNNR